MLAAVVSGDAAVLRLRLRGSATTFKFPSQNAVQVALPSLEAARNVQVSAGLTPKAQFPSGISLAEHSASGQHAAAAPVDLRGTRHLSEVTATPTVTVTN